MRTNSVRIADSFFVNTSLVGSSRPDGSNFNAAWRQTLSIPSRPLTNNTLRISSLSGFSCPYFCFTSSMKKGKRRRFKAAVMSTEYTNTPRWRVVLRRFCCSKIARMWNIMLASPKCFCGKALYKSKADSWPCLAKVSYTHSTAMPKCSRTICRARARSAMTACLLLRLPQVQMAARGTTVFSILYIFCFCSHFFVSPNVVKVGLDTDRPTTHRGHPSIRFSRFFVHVSLL